MFLGTGYPVSVTERQSLFLMKVDPSADKGVKYAPLTAYRPAVFPDKTEK